jgi:hypothetical protein
VEGDVVYVTNADTSAVVDRRPATFVVLDDSGWRVSAYTPATPDRAPAAASDTGGTRPASAAPASPASPASPAAGTSSGSARRAAPPSDSAVANVIQRYYAAINARRFDDAYALWRDGANSQSRAEFAAGYANTERVQVTIGDRITIEGAAGSQYATVPVSVDAVLRDGRRQHFEGTYTLRRSMVDGATAEQRRWGIAGASLRER